VVFVSLKEEAKQILGKWLKWYGPILQFEDLNAIGETLVELPEPKSKKKKKL
jgi:hypothetical protein